MRTGNFVQDVSTYLSELAQHAPNVLLNRVFCDAETLHF